MKNKILIGIAIIVVVAFVVGIILLDAKQNKADSDKKANQVNATNTTTTSTKKTTFDYGKATEKQMALPKEGETIAIIKVKDFGDIKVKFFDEVAPKAVENFVTHSKEGYYDGTTFHRVMEDFMIQGGDPLGNGTGGESIWGEDFEEELDMGLVPYKGALCMASRGTGTKSLGSQFFIVQADYSEKMADLLKQNGYPEDLIEQYEKYGGYMSLYQGYTVFGQVFQGLDVVDKIAKVEKNITSRGEESEPVEPVVIEKIEITEY